MKRKTINKIILGASVTPELMDDVYREAKKKLKKSRKVERQNRKKGRK